nr:YceK/YidQ family lipoprotein [uncultured Pseudomonas sp.]
MTIKMTAALSIAAVLLSGCGTVNSVVRKDGDTARELRLVKTYCQSIPRIYSGVAFDFCALNAAPDPTGFLIPFVLVDIAVSAVADSVVLPLTIYRQTVDGNISIYWRPGRS